MKTPGTSADGTDLLEEIIECLSLAEKGQAPTFESDLQSRLIGEMLPAHSLQHSGTTISIDSLDGLRK